MSPLVRAGLIGGGARVEDLVRYAAPLEGVRLVRCWPGVEGVVGAEVAADWQAVARDPGLDALIVLSGPEANAAVRAGLGAGKRVLCVGPCARGMAEVERLEAERRGVLLCGDELSFTDAARHALPILAAGKLGAVHSLYLAIRTGRRQEGGAAVLDAVGWEACRFVLDCIPGRLLRVHASGSRLFGAGAGPDAVVVIARFAPDVVVTMELSQSLPASLPAGRHGEVQFEIVGAEEVLRGEPYNTALRHYGEAGASALVWGDDPIIAMIAELAGEAAGGRPPGRGVAGVRRLVEMMQAIETSLAEGAA